MDNGRETDNSDEKLRRKRHLGWMLLAWPLLIIGALALKYVGLDSEDHLMALVVIPPLTFLLGLYFMKDVVTAFVFFVLPVLLYFVGRGVIAGLSP
ncbi:hypothetical protein [Oryzicola mucosus]|uniref:Uncharacterized protein n=1 Tax=Oryzicola mucosus TaxID=2767425 RepID=A0A8J6PX13_9HYPH|nr:hypothetical protein [Oryzicola mucosus]MBD0416656.1 hypothetical protein [Oryzicola mucosus]